MIDWKLKLISLLSILLIIIVITHFVKKDKIVIKYAIIWYISLIVLLLFSIFPEIFDYFAKKVGFIISSNFIFVLLIGFLFTMCISLTIIVSGQKDTIRKLIQEVSILKADKGNRR